MPDIANHFIDRNANISHRYNLRKRGAIISKIAYSSSFGEKSIQLRGANIWNTLPAYLRDCESLKCFKKHFKEYLFEDFSVEDDDIYIYY